jgi:hypothetical protein
MQNEHLIKTWCEMFGVEYNGEMPSLSLTGRERTFFGNKYSSDKPIFLLQSNGGAPNDMKYSWARDLPRNVVSVIIDVFRSDYNIVHIKREDQLSFENTIPVTDTFRALAVLIEMITKRFFIVSFAQHTACALNKPSTVCWIANKPEVFGYLLHDNILSESFTIKPELRNAYLGKFNIGGEITEFPYRNETEIFDIDKIIKSLKK